MRSSREQFGREFDRFRLEEAGSAILASRMHTILLSFAIARGFFVLVSLHQGRGTLMTWKLSAICGDT
jgi:hypothetical protein